MSFSSPDKPNPFADAPANPYAAPAYVGQDPLLPFTREQARLRLLGPAIGLGLFSALWIGYLGFVSIMLLSAGGRMPPPQDPTQQVAQMVGMGLGMVLFTIPPIVTIVGAVQMLRVKSYGLCWTAAILGVVPCTLYCFIFTLPFGIWGMIVLYDSRMKAAFSEGASPFVAR